MHPLLLQSICVCEPICSKIRSASASQHHQITHCALRGANSSHKMLKHYLGGRKQLDSLESDASRQAATGMREGGGGKKWSENGTV